MTGRNGSSSGRDQRSSSGRDQRTSSPRDQRTSSGRDQRTSSGRDQRTSSERDQRSSERDQRSSARDQRQRADGDSRSPVVLARQASADLAELLGREPEAITSLERTDDGWRVGVEILEIRRIPDTADVLAEYEVEADEEGHLTAYRRTRRYTRGHVDNDR